MYVSSKQFYTIFPSCGVLTCFVRSLTNPDTIIPVILEVTMHIVVFGAGGVGGYFGGRLAASGQEVTFIARGMHLEALLSQGLTVQSPKGDFSVHPVHATDDTSQVRDVNVVLVCVKAWQIPECARAILPMLNPATIVVPLENGIEAPSQLADILGEGHVLGGLCRISSHIVSPGHIQHSAIEPKVIFGELDNHLSLRARSLLENFHRAGITAEIPPDINVAMWDKFLFVSSISGVGSLTRVPVGLFRSLPGTRRILIEALEECYAIAIAKGIAMPSDSVANTLSYINSLPVDTIPSMQRDIMDGHPSELESQNGAVVRLGRILNIPTPNHEFIYHSLLPQETLARGS
jgi:2-dehydropantoate 2-reductase